MVVFGLVPELEGLVVGLDSVPHPEYFVLPLVVHIAWHLILVVPESEGQVLYFVQVYAL